MVVCKPMNWSVWEVGRFVSVWLWFGAHDTQKMFNLSFPRHGHGGCVLVYLSIHSRIVVHIFLLV